MRPDSEIAAEAGIKLTESRAIDVNEYMEANVEGGSTPRGGCRGDVERGDR